MARVIAVRAWYSRGRAYRSADDLDSFWTALPDEGVLAIVLYESTLAPGGHPMRRLLAGRDRYYKAGAVFAHTDASGDEIRKLVPLPQIKRGELVADGEYEAVIRQAMAAKEP